MSNSHPFLRRLNWNPLVVSIPFLYLTVTTYQRGFPLPLLLGAIFVGLWFAMSCYDYFTSHKLLDWMYEDDDEKAADDDVGQPPVPVGLAREALESDDEELAWEAFKVAGQALNDAKGEFNSKVHLLPIPWRMVYTLLTLDSEVNNGGFHQFFANAGGVFDEFLMDVVRELGENPYAPLIESAYNKYKGIDYHSQWENRGKSWDFFTAPYDADLFGEQEEEYYQTSPDLPAWVGKHIRENFERYQFA